MKNISKFFSVFFFISAINIVFGQCIMNQTADISVCSNNFVNTIQFSSFPNSSSYTWTCDNSNIGLVSSGSDFISTFYTSNTTQLEVATIIVTASLNCSDTFQITVFPIPQLNIGNDIFVCQGDSVTLNASSNGSIVWNNNVTNGETILPTSSEIYIATATNNYNCSVVDTLNLVVRNFEVNAGNDINLCAPDSLTFVGSSTISGTNLNTTFLPDGNGTSYQTSINFNSAQANAVITSVSDFNRIELEMEHSYLGDLEMKLTCPNGNFVSILNMYSPSAFGTQLIPGGCGSGIGTFLGNDTNLDGGAIGTPIITYAFSPSQATFGTICSENTAGNTIANAYGFQMMNPNGVYLPDGDFNDLIGCPINGTWTITIQDNQGIDDGYIASWGIKFNESNTFWDNNIENNVPFFVSETTTYTLTGIDSLGCQDTDQIIVSVNAPSDTTIIITADNSFSLNNIQYTESGIYNQSLTNIFGCDSTITIDLTVLDIGATNINQSSINVYPNPTNDVVSIVSSIVFLGKEYQLLDQAGRELVKGQFTAEKTTISLKHLASGIYFLKAKDSQPIKIVRN